MASAVNAINPINVRNRPRPFISTEANSTAAIVTPVRSCRTLQPSRVVSVTSSVVRRELRVMLAMTTLEDRATHNPSTAAGRSSTPSASNDAPRNEGRNDHLHRRGHQKTSLLTPQLEWVDFDAHLEEQKHHAEIGQELEALAIRHETRRKGRHGEAEGEVAHHGRQPHAAGRPSRGNRPQEHESNLEYPRCRFVHVGMVIRPSTVGCD